MKSPKTSDVYRCQKCEFEIQVTAGCNCNDCSVVLQCCGQSLEKVDNSKSGEDR